MSDYHPCSDAESPPDGAGSDDETTSLRPSPRAPGGGAACADKRRGERGPDGAGGPDGDAAGQATPLTKPAPTQSMESTLSAPTAPRERFPPLCFDNFRIVQELGEGGMGRVFRARDVALGRDVAIKFMHHPSQRERDRFRREAKAAAQIDHPNVVRIHHFGDLAGEPYIVEEYVPGRHLGRRPSRVMDWAAVHSLAIELASGLAAAHEQGVLHRDIKPANVLVSESGTLKLVDFGLAKLLREEIPDEQHQLPDTRPQPLLRSPARPPAGRRAQDEPPSSDDGLYTMAPTQTQTGTIMGTPHYIAPEIYRREAFTTASDVYSLAVLLYELCAGAPPFRSVDRAVLHRAVTERDAPPLAEAAPAAPAAFAALIDRCLARSPDLRPKSGRELFLALRALARPRRPNARDGADPYPGMRPFDAADAACFFGRDADVDWIVERLRTRPMVAIVGPSGLGKSSLLRAGVLPRLTSRPAGGDAPWQAHTLLPGERPLRALSRALAPHVGADVRAVEERLRSEPAALGAPLERRLATSAGLVLAVDQLEELVTTSGRDEAIAFGRALAALAERVPTIRVLATVRGAELAALVHFPGLGELLTRSQYWPSALGRAQLREAIERPARERGVEFASPEVVDELLDGAGDTAGSLPLLQFALSKLWAARDRDKGEIPPTALADIGGVAGALARHANEVLEETSAQATRDILTRLASLRGTHVRQPRDALTRGAPAAEEALDTLVAGRLVVARRLDDQVSYEIAHEALITGWPRLQAWLQDADRELDVKRKLAQTAAFWHEQGRTRATLGRGPLLRETRGLEPADLPSPDAEFLRASRRLRRWRRLGAVAIPLLIALAAGLVHANHRRDEWRQVDELLLRAQEPQARANELYRAYRSLREQSSRHLADIDPRPPRADAASAKRSLEAAERSWKKALALVAALERELLAAGRPLEQALQRQPDRRDVRAAVLHNLTLQAHLAEALGRETTLLGLRDRIELFDAKRAARWTRLTPVEVRTTPPGLRFDVYVYEAGPDGSMSPALHYERQTSPARLALAPGSYRLEIHIDGHAAPIRYPFWLAPSEGRADEPRIIELEVPAADAIPAGYVWIPPGRLWAGFGGDPVAEGTREWELAPPLHQRETDGFLIARYEATFGDWIEYLRALPPEERAARLPRVEAPPFLVALVEDRRGFTLKLRLSDDQPPYAAGEGEPIAYRDRADRRAQDWRRFPVTAISALDARAYLAWLDETGRVPGARLCREDEWLRAARGADRRVYPHGQRLSAGEANIDLSYGRFAGMGPDEVGSHPRSRSPFGLDDMAGNATEMTSSVFHDGGQITLRSGSFLGTARMSELVNRDFIPAKLRDPKIGFRVCADLPSK